MPSLEADAVFDTLLDIRNYWLTPEDTWTAAGAAEFCGGTNPHGTKQSNKSDEVSSWAFSLP